MSNSEDIAYTEVSGAATATVEPDVPSVTVEGAEIMLIWAMTEKYAVPGAGVELMAGLRAKLRPIVIEAQKAAQRGGRN